MVHNQYWRFGPEWLLNRDQWPPDITLEPSAASNAEAKTTREVLAVAIPRNDTFDELLNKHELWKVLRICSWIRRFFHNCRMPIKERNSGPLKSVEVERQKMWWIKRVQRDAQANQGFNEDRLRLNLQPNKENILECRGRIQGEYPTYLPDDHQYTKKLVHQAHLATLHGGVALTMARVRERYWVPRLRRLVKKVRRSCWGCKRFQIRAFESPPPGNLPVARTQGDTPYQVIGVDFAGPMKYLVRAKTEGKAYLVIYACSLTRSLLGPTTVIRN